MKYTSLFLLVAIQITFAQKKDDNLGTEVVNVVKPYTPTISDAFKVKETPNFDDDEVLKKETINYTINSYPVASTFTPSKGRAAAVEKSAQKRLFSNYATLGFGSYLNAIGELYVTHNLSDNEYIAGMLRHKSSQGNIKNVTLDNKFYDTRIDAEYGNKQPEMDWKINLGYQNQIYNWYGIDENAFQNYIPTLQETFLNNLGDPKVSYNTLNLGAKVGFKEQILTDFGIIINRFSDNFSSSENQINLKPNFKFLINENEIKLKTSLDYIATKFNQSYGLTDDFYNENSYLSFNLNPSFQKYYEEISFSIGATFTYLNKMKDVTAGFDNGTKSSFYIYPNVTASYKISGENAILYAGLEGGLQQNSYRELVNNNPFVSPTLSIIPTDRQFEIYGGLKGKVSKIFSYNVRASLENEKNKPLFKSNPNQVIIASKPYEFGNSFGVVYDNIRTLSFFGELKAAVTQKFVIGLNGTFANYAEELESEAWNLPSIKIGSTIDYDISEKWFAGLKVYFVGERNDQIVVPNSITGFDFQTVKIDGFFDANFELGYQYNERFTAFFKANNLGNQAYQCWYNFPTQQLQLLVGANYKFDF